MNIREKTMITVRTIVSKDIDTVWELWTSTRHIIHWNNASNDWFTPFAENDLRVNGKFKYRMEPKNGSGGFDFEGVYDEVVLPEAINYTIADGRKVELSFRRLDGGTEIVETFEAEHENPENLQRNGWQAILDNFKKYAEEFVGDPERTFLVSNQD